MRPHDRESQQELTKTAKLAENQPIQGRYRVRHHPRSPINPKSTGSSKCPNDRFWHEQPLTCR